MKKLIYIFVSLILLSSLFPTMNYSSPAVMLEITLESPEAETEALLQSKEIIAKRLESYGVNGFEIIALPKEGQLKINLPEVYAQEPVLPLLINQGEVFFCETFNRKEIAILLQDAQRKSGWTNWMSADPSKVDEGVDDALIARLNRKQISDFSHFINQPDNRRDLPLNLYFAFGRFPNEKDQLNLYALKYDDALQALMDNESIQSAKAREMEGGLALIELQFTAKGAEKLAEATRLNLDRTIAIVVDDLVYMAPKVKSEITGGRLHITGRFSMEEAKMLAAIAQTDPLPLLFTVAAE